MNEQEIRKIVKDEMQKNYRSGSPMVPPHTHNGIDGLRITESNLIYNNKIIGGLTATDGGGTLSLSLLKNPSSFYFYGFLRNPASGSATKKYTITGHAEFGNCFDYTSASSQIPLTDKVIQTYDFFGVNTISSTFSVGQGGNEGFAGIDDTSVLHAFITNVTSTTIDIQVDLASDYTLVGTYIIT